MSKDKRTGWIAKIKVGDTVRWDGGGTCFVRVVTAKVLRITPTGRMVTGAWTFMPNGWSVGGKNVLLDAEAVLMKRRAEARQGAYQLALRAATTQERAVRGFRRGDPAEAMALTVYAAAVNAALEELCEAIGGEK